jgi:hypothetical protein
MSNNCQSLQNKLTQNNKNLQIKYKNINTKINKSNTLFILDWDDTLFPTSWAVKNKIDLMTASTRDKYMEDFKELDRTLATFLKNIQHFGKVVIITHAMVDWVKISSIVIPHTYNLLKGIDVISARSLFSHHTNEIMYWKKLAFQFVIDNEYKNKYTMNIISVGDAEYEHNALVSLTQTNINKIKYLKSFRLIKDPHYDQVVDQLNVLNINIPKLWFKHKQLCKTFKMF